MRIDEALDPAMELRELLAGSLARLLDRRDVVNDLAVTQDWDERLSFDVTGSLTSR